LVVVDDARAHFAALHAALEHLLTALTAQLAVAAAREWVLHRAGAGRDLGVRSAEEASAPTVGLHFGRTTVLGDVDAIGAGELRLAAVHAAVEAALPAELRALAAELRPVLTDLLALLAGLLARLLALFTNLLALRAVRPVRMIRIVAGTSDRGACRDAGKQEWDDELTHGTRPFSFLPREVLFSR
jgi:hypothetical protein